MDLITIVMWVSGWWYFTKLRERIEVLEQQMSSPREQQVFTLSTKEEKNEHGKD